MGEAIARRQAWIAEAIEYDVTQRQTRSVRISKHEIASIGLAISFGVLSGWCNVWRNRPS